MVHRRQLSDYLDELLCPEALSDFTPNGLQVEGRNQVRRLITGVTASARFLAEAIEADADAVLVHHGYFWKGEPPPITGTKAHRLRLLLRNDINLFAYHLPLDVHPIFGNNAVLAQWLGIEVGGAVEAGGVPGLLWYGHLADAVGAEAFADRLATRLGRWVTPVVAGPHPVRRVAWCSGGGQKFVAAAAALGVDAYFSGEISEPTAHEARELGVHYFAAGHHATERGGVQALGNHLAGQFGLDHRFIDDDNPA